MTPRHFSRLATFAGVAFLAGMSCAVLTATPARAEPAVTTSRPTSVTLPMVGR